MKYIIKNNIKKRNNIWFWNKCLDNTATDDNNNDSRWNIMTHGNQEVRNFGKEILHIINEVFTID